MRKVSHFIHRLSESVFGTLALSKKARVHQRRSTKCSYQTFWLLLFCCYSTK